MRHCYDKKCKTYHNQTSSTSIVEYTKDRIFKLTSMVLHIG